MEPGEVRVLENVKSDSALKGFHSHFEGLGIPAQCEFWTYPACRNKDENVKRVWVLRTDGLTESQIKGIRAKSIKEHQESDFSGVRKFILDGAELCKDIPESLARRRPRTSKSGWELMKVGEFKMVRMLTRDVRNFISLSLILRRQSTWAYECERDYLQERDLNSNTPFWIVTRIR